MLAFKGNRVSKTFAGFMLGMNLMLSSPMDIKSNQIGSDPICIHMAEVHERLKRNEVTASSPEGLTKFNEYAQMLIKKYGSYDAPNWCAKAINSTGKYIHMADNVVYYDPSLLEKREYGETKEPWVTGLVFLAGISMGLLLFRGMIE